MNMTGLASGLTLGGAAGAAIMFAEAAITGSTSIPIESAVATATFVCGLVWWIGRKFQSLDDSIKDLRDEMVSRPCHLTGQCKGVPPTEKTP